MVEVTEDIMLEPVLVLCIVQGLLDNVKYTKGKVMGSIPVGKIFFFLPRSGQAEYSYLQQLNFSCSELKLVFLFIGGESSSGNETTPLIEGPSDTSEMYTGNLFRSTHLQENIVESMGPVLSFTVQVPQAAIRSGDPVTQPGKCI